MLLLALLACAGISDTSLPLGTDGAAAASAAHGAVDRKSAGPGGIARHPDWPEGTGRPDNILVIVADDLGAETMACYGGHGVRRAPQPNMAHLCRDGVVFDRAWANPMCSPTRASMLTGREAWRLGIGEPVGGAQPGLSSEELALPAALDRLGTGHVTAAFGKWHLADTANGGVDHPNLAGFGHYAGALRGEVPDFYDWDRVVDGETAESTTYATTANVDDALEWVGDQTDPWMMWVAFNAPHFPIHLPPEDLHGYSLVDDDDAIDADPVPYFLAMVEAMDTEIGRLLDGLDPTERARTWVILIGDNGTWAPVNQGFATEERSKGSVYEAGVHVPLIVVGPDLVDPGRREDAIVSSTNIFSTVIELAGGDPDELVDAGIELDSTSLVPYLLDPEAAVQREVVTAAVYGPSTAPSLAGQAVYDGEFKLIRLLNGTEALYNLAEDPRETKNLLSRSLSLRATIEYADLSARLDEMPIDEFWH